MTTIDMTRIAGNIGALNALYSLTAVNNQLAIHQTRLATGKRINESADDPAGMSLATGFDIRRQGLQTALKAIGDAKNLMSTSEGGLRKIQEILIKMRNKSTEAIGDTIGEAERRVIQEQVRAYREEINDIVAQTQWNGNQLIGISGSAGTTPLPGTNPLNFLTGPSGEVSAFRFVSGSASNAAGVIMSFQTFGVDITLTTTGSAGMAGVVNGLGLHDANLTLTDTDATSGGLFTSGSVARLNAFQAIESALAVVKQGISQVGAFTARLTFKEESLSVNHVNTEAAFNRIMNANMAEEQVEASKYMILQQTSTAMLAQANNAPQYLLSLFK